MSKLRINPRGNSQSEDLEKKVARVSEHHSDLGDKTLDYFLNKNASDFTKEDLDRFEGLNKQRENLFFETSRQVTIKLFAISKTQINKSSNNFSNKDDTIKSDINLPFSLEGLRDLLLEVKEDDYDGNMLFIVKLIDNLILIDKELIIDNLNINSLYDSMSNMLHDLQDYNISQQKYIYRSLANIINKRLNSYRFISPEDGSFIDPKFHKIVSGNGQRIVRGLTYILLDKKNDEVLKFGNVKTT